jgi:hypothetical protein
MSLPLVCVDVAAQETWQDGNSLLNRAETFALYTCVSGKLTHTTTLEPWTLVSARIVSDTSAMFSSAAPKSTIEVKIAAPTWYVPK